MIPFRKVFDGETRDSERSGIRARLNGEQQQRKAMALDGSRDNKCLGAAVGCVERRSSLRPRRFKYKEALRFAQARQPSVETCAADADTDAIRTIDCSWYM